jgi:hypothetical protein
MRKLTGLQDEKDGKVECCADLRQIRATVLLEENTDDGVLLRASVSPWCIFSSFLALRIYQHFVALYIFGTLGVYQHFVALYMSGFLG